MIRSIDSTATISRLRYDDEIRHLPSDPGPAPENPDIPETTGIDTHDTAPLWDKIISKQYQPAYEAAANTISTYFGHKGYETAQALIDHYRGGSGSTYELSSKAVDDFMTDDSPDVAGSYQGPANWLERARTEAINRAVEAAKADPSLYGQPQSITIPWETVRANTNQDGLLSLGSFQASLTAEVVVYPPGADGQVEVQLASQTHVYDVYDFAKQDNPLEHHQNAASQMMYRGNLLGYFRAFEVVGSGSVVRQSATVDQYGQVDFS